MIKKIRVPLYEALVYFVVADDIFTERKNMSDLFGGCPDNNFDACCSYNKNGIFALFFEPKALTHKTIAHEIFHLTHRIAEWRYGAFVESYHEIFADLCGYLTEFVYQNIGGDVMNEQLQEKRTTQKGFKMYES